MDVLKVDGTELPTPTSMEYKEADLQSEGYRDSAGLMHKTTVRWGVRTIKVKWDRRLSSSELRDMRALIKGKEYITLTYYSDALGMSGTMTAYTGDMDYQLVRATNSGIWWGLALSFIEQ